jgi:hypothetical protein
MLNELPLELLFCILSLIRNKSVGRLVCRQWRMIIDRFGCNKLYRLPSQSPQEFARAVALYRPQHVDWGSNGSELDFQALANITKLSMYYLRAIPAVWPGRLTSLQLVNMRCDLNMEALEGIVELEIFDAMVFGRCTTLTKLSATSVDTIDLSELPNLRWCSLSYTFVVDYDPRVLGNLDYLELNQTMFQTNAYLDCLTNIPILTLKSSHAYMRMPQRMLAHTLYVSYVTIPDEWELPNIKSLTLQDARADIGWDLATIPSCTDIKLYNVVNVFNGHALNARHVTWQNSAHYVDFDEFSFNPPAIKTLNILNLTPTGARLDIFLRPFVNLRVLNLNVNGFCTTLTDLPQLEELTVRSLHSLQTLGHFPKLKVLFVNIRGLQLVDILWDTMPLLHTMTLIGNCAVHAPPSLQHLTLQDNVMLHTLPLMPQTLQSVRLYRCFSLGNIDSAAHVNTVLLNDCPLITNLQPFDKLIDLTLERTSIQRVLDKHADCQTLTLRHAPVRTLPQLLQVTCLNISDTNVTDLSFLHSAMNLRELIIDRTLVRYLQPLINLPVLRTVSATSCVYIEDVAALYRVWKIILVACVNLNTIQPLLYQDTHVVHLNVEGCTALPAHEMEQASELIAEFKADNL